MSRIAVNRFFAWYERNLKLHSLVVTILFTWQLAHLYWLTTHVVAERLFDASFFPASLWLQRLVITADYAEIPALLSASVLYLHAFRQRRRTRDILYLILINTQWVHILWITDEYVVNVLGTATTGFPFGLAWLAIAIDYLELPVIYDTIKKTFVQRRNT